MTLDVPDASGNAACKPGRSNARSCKSMSGCRSGQKIKVWNLFVRAVPCLPRGKYSSLEGSNMTENWRNLRLSTWHWMRSIFGVPTESSESEFDPGRRMLLVGSVAAAAVAIAGVALGSSEAEAHYTGFWHRHRRHRRHRSRRNRHRRWRSRRYRHRRWRSRRGHSRRRSRRRY